MECIEPEFGETPLFESLSLLCRVSFDLEIKLNNFINELKMLYTMLRMS